MKEKKNGKRYWYLWVKTLKEELQPQLLRDYIKREERA